MCYYLIVQFEGQMINIKYCVSEFITGERQRKVHSRPAYMYWPNATSATVYPSFLFNYCIHEHCVGNWIVSLLRINKCCISLMIFLCKISLQVHITHLLLRSSTFIISFLYLTTLQTVAHYYTACRKKSTDTRCLTCCRQCQGGSAPLCICFESHLLVLGIQ